MEEEKKEPKIQMTGEQMVEEVQQIIQPLVERISKLEEEARKPRELPAIPSQVINNDLNHFIICNANFATLPDVKPEDLQKMSGEFSKELQTLMEKYKIFRCEAAIYHKF